MKIFFAILVCILILVIFQTSLLAPWFSNYFQPDILLVFLAAATVVFGFQATWPWIILAGFMLDLFSYSKIGTHVIIYILTSYLVSFVSRRFALGTRGAGMVLVVFLMPFISALDFWGVIALNDISVAGRIFNWQSFLTVGVITLENIALFFVFYAIIRKFQKRYSPTQFRLSK